jgi:uncharacterized phage protein (TIGR02220 family)
MQWIKSNKALQSHPKLLQLASGLKPLGVPNEFSVQCALGIVHELWYWATDYAEDGYLTKYDTDFMMQSVGFGNNSSKIFELLVNCGFIDTEPCLKIHDWWEYIGGYITSKYCRGNYDRYKEIKERAIGSIGGAPMNKDRFRRILKVRRNKEKAIIEKGIIDKKVEDVKVIEPEPKEKIEPVTEPLPETEKEQKKEETVKIEPIENDKPVAPDPKEVAKEVLEFLNKKSGKKFSSHSVALQRLISGRLREGFTMEDLKLVVVFKCREWVGNEKYYPYLQPSTIFSPEHFPEYLANAKYKSEKEEGGIND